MTISTKARQRALPLALCLVTQAVASSFTLAAELRQDEDYLAIVLEAENHDSADERWVLTEPGTPQQEQDPDGNHSDQAAGMAYLELLPDVRVTHDDPFNGPPQGFWGRAGEGPIASYTVNFPEPGRYHVHVRAFSTGFEDNGLHVGLNGEWPESGERLQICTSSELAWRWTSQQRDSGGRVCGTVNTIWVTVPSAGEHSFQISAREDGFEIDRVMLIKDLSNNTRICTPVTTEADRISCRNGSLDLVDERVDLNLEVTSELEEVDLEEPVEVSATLYNADGQDIATGVELRYNYSNDDWTTISFDERCESAANGVVCQIGQLAPAEPEAAEIFLVVLEPKVEGVLPVLVEVSSTEQDDNEVNNSAQVDIQAKDVQELGQLEVAVSAAGEVRSPGQDLSVFFFVSNEGPASVNDTRLTIEVPAQFEIVNAMEMCAITTAQLICELDVLEADTSVSMAVGVRGLAEGLYTLSATASALNSADASDSVLVELIAEQPDPDAGVDSGPDNGAVDGSDPDVDMSSVSNASKGSGVFGILTAGVLLLLGWWRGVGSQVDRSSRYPN